MKSIAFFVYYNNDSKVADHTKYALESIREIYDDIIIISNSKLSGETLKLLSGYSDELIVRENIGYDFAAWRDGIEKVGWNNLKKYQTVTLVNDTCYFPLSPLKETVSKFNNDKNIDFWGASIHKASKKGMPRSNGPVSEHIQSYFMTFNKKVVKSSTFQTFWNSVENLKDVEDVIIRYETKLTPTLSKQGFRYGALFSPEVHNDKGIINAVYQTPRLLIKRKFPFLKIKAVDRSNVEVIKKEIVSSGSTYPTMYISIKQNSLKVILDYLINNTHWLFLIIALIASVAFMAITPVGFGGDEEAHIYRAYHISTGSLFTEDLGNGNNGLIPDNLSRAVERGYDAASDSRFGSSIMGRKDIVESGALDLQQLVDAPINPSETHPEKFSNTNPYNPVMYIGAALGFKLSAMMNISVEWSVFLARFMNAIPFFIISTLALFILRGTKVRWLVFFVLLLPTVISYVATVNGDPYNIAVVMLFLAVFTKCVTSLKIHFNKRLRILIIASTLLLASAKLPSVLLSSLVILIPKDYFGGRKKKWAIIVGIFVLIGLLTALPMLASSKGEYNTGVKEQSQWILQNPSETIGVYANTLFRELPDYINRSVGVMGRNGVFVYQTVITLLVTWLIILGLWINKGSKKIATLYLLTGVGLCLLAMTFLYLADSKPGASIIWGVHGKYFTPFIPFMLYGLTALPISVSSKGRYVEYCTVAISVSVLFISAVMYNLALY